jgi:hypothetical protein
LNPARDLGSGVVGTELRKERQADLGEPAPMTINQLAPAFQTDSTRIWDSAAGAFFAACKEMPMANLFIAMLDRMGVPVVAFGLEYSTDLLRLDFRGG